ncbi:lysosome-associated membrane glyco 2-like isoform X2 [Brachionus plicatilis]|uniref:Lysosome-associated membrane glyco 2-like isoform X2 n=1 Tax=Brachionus plicatilis TaxID=10195 RepID=A0A3M7SMJ2_BRAPC|nr:lysosome-associated membrane glyco 2-like isoform X2 [Brachionus plicatilis]
MSKKLELMDILAFIIVYLISISKNSCSPVDEYETEDLFPIFEFIIPRNDPTYACLKLQTSLFLSVAYPAKVGNEELIKKVNFSIGESDISSYTGFCQKERNQIEIIFLNEWRLEFYFYRTNETYLFDHVVLYYKLDGALFPDSIHHGAQSEVYDYTFVNSTLSHSFRCNSGILIDLGEVKIDLVNFKVEAFFDKRPNLPFDEEIVCEADKEPLSQIFQGWLYIFAALIAFLVVISTLYLFMIHRSHAKKIKREQRSDPFEIADNQENLDESNYNETIERTHSKEKKRLVVRV